MASDLDKKLLETDLERCIALSDPEVVGVECDQGGEECLMLARAWSRRRNVREAANFDTAQREYVVLHREDLVKLKRELATFQRRFKEVYGR